jgi:XTP/dITP diphosphohydrolase
MTNLPDLLIGTRNEGKIREIRMALEGLPLRLRTLHEFSDVADAIESGTTYEDNATIKARHYAEATGLWVMADDSGLEVMALDGGPGVYSARYGRDDASDEDRVRLLLSELAEVEDRRARFVSVIAITGDEIQLCRETCEGRLSHEPLGNNGFGYDPIFIPDGYTETFGQLSPVIKERLSHRGKALAVARTHLQTRLQPRHSS